MWWVCALSHHTRYWGYYIGTDRNVRDEIPPDNTCCAYLESEPHGRPGIDIHPNRNAPGNATAPRSSHAYFHAARDNSRRAGGASPGTDRIIIL